MSGAAMDFGDAPVLNFRQRIFERRRTGAVFFFAQLLQVGQGYGPLGAGLRLMPWTATFITIAPIAGALSDKIGERPLMVVGLTLQAAGMAWLALIAEPSLPYSHMVAPFVDGFGPAIGVAAGISLAGAAAGLALPGRGRARRVNAVAALETHA